MDKIRHTFRKEERLSSRKEIALLFENGQSVMVYPLKFFWKESDPGSPSPVRMAFTVSSRTFKKAVDRNLLKRRMREAYRLNKHKTETGSGDKKINIMVIYIAREIVPYASIEKAVRSGMKKIIARLTENHETNQQAIHKNK